MNTTNKYEKSENAEKNQENIDIRKKSLMRTISYCSNAERNSFGMGKNLKRKSHLPFCEKFMIRKNQHHMGKLI